MTGRGRRCEILVGGKKILVGGRQIFVGGRQIFQQRLIFVGGRQIFVKDLTGKTIFVGGRQIFNIQKEMTKRASITITQLEDGRASIQARMTIEGKGIGKGDATTPALPVPLHEPVVVVVSPTRVSAFFEQEAAGDAASSGRYTTVAASIEPPSLEVVLETE